MRVSKIIGFAASAGILALSTVGVASAHVVIKPSDVQTGAEETFSVSVPTERDDPTVAIKLIIPDDVTEVTPTVKPGWNIQIDKQGTGVDAVVKAITWTGGEIGPGYRDDFTFSAKMPDHSMDLDWKAYQTYKGGAVVSWDQSNGTDADIEGATSGPFSVTKVEANSAQDIALKNDDSKAMNAQNKANNALYVAIVGIVTAAAAIVMSIVYKPKANQKVM